jgi:hypothetical protein
VFLQECEAFDSPPGNEVTELIIAALAFVVGEEDFCGNPGLDKTAVDRMNLPEVKRAGMRVIQEFVIENETDIEREAAFRCRA